MAVMRTLLVGLLLSIPAPTPQATMTATCDAVTFSVSGYPEGSMVEMWADSGMPFQFIVGQPADWYTSEEGGGSGSLPMTGHLGEWDWAIDIETPDGVDVRPVSGHITCVLMAEPIVEVEPAAPAAPTVQVSPWADVELAPPW